MVSNKHETTATYSRDSFASIPYECSNRVRITSRKANVIMPKKKLSCILLMVLLVIL